MTKFDLNDLEQFEQFVGDVKIKLEIENGKGDVAVMELEPLESRHIGKIVYLQNNIPTPKVKNPVEVKAGGKPIYETDEEFQSRLKESDYDAYGKMFDVLSLWIKQCYPNLPDAPLRKMVMNNAQILLEAFMKQHNDVDEETGKTKEVKDFIAEKRNAKATDTQKTEE